VATKAEWMTDAACRKFPASELDWFTGDQERYTKGSRAKNWTEQRAVCASCPVRKECFDDAIETDMVFQERRGIGFHFRAGMSALERWKHQQKIDPRLDDKAAMIRRDRKNMLDSDIKLEIHANTMAQRHWTECFDGTDGTDSDTLDDIQYPA
jgi:hypothetical protein